MKRKLSWKCLDRDWRSASFVTAIMVLSGVLYWEHMGLYFRGQLDVRDDLGAFHLPMLLSVTDSLRKSVDFNWNDRYFGGFSLIGEGQVATTHPIRMAAYRFLDFDFVFMLETILPVILIQFGTYKFLRFQKLSGTVSLYGAFLYAFSGVIAARWFHVNYLYAFGHSIWSIYVCSCYALTTSRSLRCLFLVSIALIKASQVMMGGPPYFVYGNIMELSYLVVFAISGEFKPDRLFFVFGAIIIGGMIGAPQLHAQFVEMTTNISETNVQDFSISRLRDLLMIFQPFNPFVSLRNHEYMFCICGTASLCSVACGMESQRRTPVMRWCMIVFWLSMAICFLGFSPLLTAVFERIPIVGQLRIHQRYGVIAAFVLVVFHCHLIQAMIDNKDDSDRNFEKRRKTLKTGLAFIALSAVVPAGILVSGSASGSFTGLRTRTIEDALRIYTPIIWQLIGVEFVILSVLVLISVKSKSSRAMLFMILAIIEVMTYTRGFARPVPLDLQLVDRYRMRQVSIENPRIAFLKGKADDPDSWQAMRANPLIVRSDTVNGYKARDPKFGIRMKSIEDLRLAAVDRIVFSNERMTYFDESRSIFVNSRNSTPPVFEMQTIKDPLPRFRLVPESAVRICQDGFGKTLEPNPPAADTRSKAFVPSTPGRLESGRIENDFKSFRIKCEIPSVLLIADSWHPDWNAILNGENATIERFHGAMQAIRIPKGNHTLTLIFQSASSRLDRTIMVTGIVLLALLSYAESRLA